ncbi:MULTISPECIES: lipopolysaccharide biosynthesis protein [Haloferax]|uniref:Polysaccharide biosynthesis protein n=1 Tax=Haloferax marinum TaxID=2666143 RepID=A0A6A8G7Y2_9EURY|nr:MULTISPECIES: lipopolysaccharide biosynthesis protein [Haloferax]KAB1197807.1 lipopolysaccharide biosynthesis protein [Haloferax sp. CBA1150]MRW96865.1 hypothetical protein [Haloferax marinum]
MATESEDSLQDADVVERRLEDALERVAHGAVVSVPAIVLERGLNLAFTALLTNSFAASTYGLFALARRLQRFLAHVTLGFRSGLSRFLPTTDADADRDVIATFASLLLLAVATLFGGVLYLATPSIAAVADEGPLFEQLLRMFAVGLPASVWLFTVSEMLRAFEEVGPLNLVLRVGFPVAQLAVGFVGAFVVRDLVAVAAGVWVAMGLVGVGAVWWVARARGLRPRIRTPDSVRLCRRYVEYTTPLFFGSIATTTQRLGFYPLIAVFLSGTASGVFAVGVLLGTVIRLPLLGINQFIPPVAAALSEEGYQNALARLYHVTSRLVLVGATGLAVPLIVFRQSIMAVFGPTFVTYAPLLPGFVLAQYFASAAGSVGILLMMTDNQRAYLVVNTAITVVLAIVAIPATATFGLAGLVGTYLLMLTVNNALEVAVLYYLEGLQPLTWAHAKPLAAAIPLAVVALGVKSVLTGPLAVVVGTAFGLVAYALAIRAMGVAPVERRLLASLVGRYRAVVGR